MSIVIGILLIIASTFSTGARVQQGKPDDLSNLLGDWTGESICTDKGRSACHDEQVIYHITKLSEPNKVRLAADKMVNGRPEEMYVQEFTYDPARRTLVGEFQNARYHGLWEYNVKGNTMEGTLSLLPERTVVRRINVRKKE